VSGAATAAAAAGKAIAIANEKLEQLICVCQAQYN
jgi:hypothetical protein